MIRGIGILGEARHGKDEVASVLVEEFGYVRRGFADALKEDVGLALAVWTDRGNPEHRAYARRYIDSLKRISEIRTLLQAYGSARRALERDYWVHRLFAWADKALFPGERLVVPDVRFRNEAEALKARGFLLVRVARPGFDNGLTPEQRAHPSEDELRDYPVDYTLYNGRSLYGLRRAACWWHEAHVLGDGQAVKDGPVASILDTDDAVVGREGIVE